MAQKCKNGDFGYGKECSVREENWGNKTIPWATLMVQKTSRVEHFLRELIFGSWEDFQGGGPLPIAPLLWSVVGYFEATETCL